MPIGNNSDLDRRRAEVLRVLAGQPDQSDEEIARDIADDPDLAPDMSSPTLVGFVRISGSNQIAAPSNGEAPKVQLFRDREAKLHWRLTTPDGRELATSPGYETEEDCLAGFRELQRLFA